MKTKLIAATIALSSLFTAGASQAATAIYNYDANNQITSLSHITGLMVDNVSYDLSFSDTWDGVYVDYDLAKRITDEFSSALNPYSVSATNSGVNAGTLDSTIGHIVEFDMYSEFASGCDTNPSVSKCDMYLITDKTINSANLAYYVSNDDKTPRKVSRGQVDYDSRNYRGVPGSYLAQATISEYEGLIIDNRSDRNAKYRTFMSAYVTPISPVPVPTAAFLFAPALLGFMGLRRKAKNLAA